MTAMICECSAVPASHNRVQFLRCEQIALQLYSSTILDFPKFSKHISGFKWRSSMQLHKFQLYSWRKALNAKKKKSCPETSRHTKNPIVGQTNRIQKNSHTRFRKRRLRNVCVLFCESGFQWLSAHCRQSSQKLDQRQNQSSRLPFNITLVKLCQLCILTSCLLAFLLYGFFFPFWSIFLWQIYYLPSQYMPVSSH